MLNFAEYDFASVMNYPEPNKIKVFDFTKGYSPDYIRSFSWGIGRYNEKRKGMYTTSQFGGKRNIHMGIDIWSEAGRPVFSFYEGEVCYIGDNAQSGDYGPTLIIRYKIGGNILYALYGHLSRMTLENTGIGETISKRQQIATLGAENVNGGWAPHLHFQLSWKDPGSANMPGVVSDEERDRSLKIYPNPNIILGELY